MRGAIYAVDEITENGTVPVYCPKCGGAGFLPEFRRDGGVCYSCFGKRGPVKFVPRAEAERILRNREKAAERRRQAEREAAEERERERQEWIAANADLAEALAAYDGHNGFLMDLAGKAEHRPLSDRQAEAARKALAREEEREESAEEVPEGRQAIRGRVVSVKAQDSMYGLTLKMLIDCGGFRVFGTIPGAIEDEVEKGVTVSMTATLEAKEPGFGFYKRPAKAEVLAAA